ncbi:MAG: ATP-binding protein, partial [Treponema sp.]|nr:ATP-binding protein [Treponema sp.]
MAEDDTTIERQITRLVYSRTREEPVILLEGPRSTGKSTVIRALAAKFKTQVFDFDDPVIREEARRNPDFFTSAEHPGIPILIDEYQRVPAVLDSIKTRLNRSTRPGQFVITGSTRHNALPGNVQALTGRIHHISIFPFAQSEMQGCFPQTIMKLLADPGLLINKEKNKPAAETRKDYVDRIIKGGFPLAVHRSPQARSRWFDDYVRQTVERDISGIAKIRNNRGLSLLLRKLAAQTAQILAIEKIAAATGIDIATARDYIQLLQDVFMVYELPAWGRTLGSRVTAKPKMHILDSGIAARLLGLTSEKLSAKEPAALTELGHLLESFTIVEILKELSWLDDTVFTGHWRTHDDKEVDFVIELMDGSIYGFEIKSATHIPESDFKGLAALRRFANDSFKAGFVLYTGRSA